MGIRSSRCATGRPNRSLATGTATLFASAWGFKEGAQEGFDRQHRCHVRTTDREVLDTGNPFMADPGAEDGQGKF